MIIRRVIANPASIPAGAGLAMQEGLWGVTWTPASNHDSTAYFGYHSLLCGPVVNNFTGGIWIVDGALVIFRASDDALVLTVPWTYLAGALLGLLFDWRPGFTPTVTVTGAINGNGQHVLPLAGPYFTDGALVAGGVTGIGGFNIDGVIGDIFDLAPDATATLQESSRAPRRRVIPVSAHALVLLDAPIVDAPLDDGVAAWAAPGELRRILRGRSRAESDGVAELLAPAPPAADVVEALGDDARAFSRRPRRRAEVEPDVLDPVAPGEAPAGWDADAPPASRAARRARLLLDEAPPVAPAAPAVDDVPDAGEPPRHRGRPAARRASHPDEVPLPARGAPRTVGGRAIRQNINDSNPAIGTLTTFSTDLVFTANPTTNRLTTASHGMIMGAGPLRLATTGTLPANLSSAATYYARVIDDTTLQVALSAADAQDGVVVDIGDTGAGTHTLVRAPTTAALYSTFLAFVARGQWDLQPAPPFDNYANAYAYVPGTPRAYDVYDTAKMAVSIAVRGRGGPAHAWSAAVARISGPADDETVIAGLELPGGPYLQDSSVVEVPIGSAVIQGAPVTATAPGLLILVVFGNGPPNQYHTFSGLDGLEVVLEASGDPAGIGYIQLSVLARRVDFPGTYVGRVSGTANEGAQIVSMMLQQDASSLGAVDWLEDAARALARAHRRRAASEDAPIEAGAAPATQSHLDGDEPPARRRVRRARAVEIHDVDRAADIPLDGPVADVERVAARARRPRSGADAVVEPLDPLVPPSPAWDELIAAGRRRTRAPRAADVGEFPTTTAAGDTSWMALDPLPTPRRRGVSSSDAAGAFVEISSVIPAVTRTWAHAAPVTCATPLTGTLQLDEARGHARVLRAIKDGLLSTGAWVVRGSSDGTSAGMDGVDRWSSDASLVWSVAPTSARSWIVLRAGAAPLEVLFDLVTAGAADGYHQWTCKVSRGGFGAGSAAAAPAASDEAILTYRHSWIEDVTGGLEGATVYAAHADGGQAHRFWVSAYNNGRAEVVSFLAFEYLRDAASPMIGAMVALTSRGRPAAAGSGADLGVQTYSPDPAATRTHVAGVTVDGRAWAGNLAWEGFGGLPANRALLLANEVTGEQALYPPVAYSQTPSMRGYVGRLQDLWVGSALLPAGTAFPGDRSRQLLSLGGLVVPWHGGPAPSLM